LLSEAGKLAETGLPGDALSEMHASDDEESRLVGAV
jgi:hypothetical protein